MFALKISTCLKRPRGNQLFKAMQFGVWNAAFSRASNCLSDVFWASCLAQFWVQFNNWQERVFFLAKSVIQPDWFMDFIGLNKTPKSTDCAHEFVESRLVHEPMEHILCLFGSKTCQIASSLEYATGILTQDPMLKGTNLTIQRWQEKHWRWCRSSVKSLLSCQKQVRFVSVKAERPQPSITLSSGMGGGVSQPRGSSMTTMTQTWLHKAVLLRHAQLWGGGVAQPGGSASGGGGSSTPTTMTMQTWFHKADSTYSRARPKKGEFQ